MLALFSSSFDFFRKGIHQGSLQNRKIIENVLSSFRSIREAQRTQTRTPSLSTNTVSRRFVVMALQNQCV